MPSSGLAYVHPPKAGTAWTEMDDAYLLEDRDKGLDLHMMAMRANRPHAEVKARLEKLAKKHPPRDNSGV